MDASVDILSNLLADHFVHAAKARGLTHGLFRFPAKMHPPLIRGIIQQFTNPEEVVFDPFCGSGTVLVEAAALGRRAYGVDVDPLAVLLSRVKSRRYNELQINRYLSALEIAVEPFRRTNAQLERLSTADLTDRYASSVLLEYDFPEIDNRKHWFRNYVAVDLARLMAQIDDVVPSGKYRDLFFVVALSAIRRVGRADPVPSSGLEVTRRMLELEREGRTIDVYADFFRHFQRQRDGITAFSQQAHSDGVAFQLDMRSDDAPEELASLFAGQKVDAVITSPPYLSAIEYGRRFKLERAFVESRYEGRVEHRTIGRRSLLNDVTPLSQNHDWLHRLEATSRRAALIALVYFSELKESIRRAAAVTRPNGDIFIIVGDSRFERCVIPIATVLEQELAEEFNLVDRFQYPLKNRYMSYARHNGEGIKTETLLHMRRRFEQPSRHAEERSFSVSINV